MDRSIRRESGKPSDTELSEPPGQRGVIRDREIDLEHLCQATEEPLGLAKRKMKDHADRQRGLDRNVRVGTLAAWFTARCLAPGVGVSNELCKWDCPTVELCCRRRWRNS
jgi:hypothetical protein